MERELESSATLLALSLSPHTDKQLSLSESIQELQQLLAGVGVSQQTAVSCLTPQTAKLVVDYITTGLFQHYRLFQYLFQKEPEDLGLNLEVRVIG